MAERVSILVVDDETVILESIRKILRSEGFAVGTSPDAESALVLLRGQPPDIALIDLALPSLSGMELLGIIRTEFPQVASIMMTGYSTLENAITALQNGAFDFLPKPFAFEELLSTVQRAGRFAHLPGEMRVLGLPVEAGQLYHLGMCVWTRVERDDTALVGITDLCQRIVGQIVQVELSVLHDQIQQGSRLVELGAADQLRHTVWSALSGRVVERNHLVEADPSLLNLDPWERGWLVRIIPNNLTNELANLRQV
jgi:DNA-binding response OmpR family regulator